MSVMAEVARRHCFQVLLHEKPFDGINGSGKHNNWSLGTDRGYMLFSAGKSPKENLRFICFIANVMAAVDRHNALLKASIASATNAHRLGANEAPPAIISIFMGQNLTRLFDSIEKTDSPADAPLPADRERLSLDLSQIPDLTLDNTDRNRTSPFAFTGNRFEFRAVGSSANCASAMIALNAAVADQLNRFADAVDRRVVRELVEARKVANRIGSEREKAIAYHDTVVPLMDEIRRHIDKLELMVDDEIWPLPKYREMLFIR